MRRMLLLAGMTTFLFAFSANAQKSVNASSLKKQVMMENLDKKCPMQVKTAQVSDFSLLKKERSAVRSLVFTRADAYNAVYARPEGSLFAGVEDDGGMYIPLIIAPSESTLKFIPGSNAQGKGVFSWYALNDQDQEIDLSSFVDDESILSYSGEAGGQYYMPILHGEYNGEVSENRYGGDDTGYVFFSPGVDFPLTNGDMYNDRYGLYDEGMGFMPSYEVNGVPCTGFMSLFDPLGAALVVDHVSLMAFKDDKTKGDIIPAGTTMTVGLSKLDKGTLLEPFATATATPEDCIELLTETGAPSGTYIINFYFPNKQSAKIDAGIDFGAMVNVTAANNIRLPFSINTFGIGSAFTLHGNNFSYFLASEKVNLCDIFIQLNGKFETDPSSIASAKSEADIKVVSSVNAFELTYPEAVTSVQVVNVAGQVVATYALEGTSATIPAANLVNGLYLLKFDNGATVKVMK